MKTMSRAVLLLVLGCAGYSEASSPTREAFDIDPYITLGGGFNEFKAVRAKLQASDAKIAQAVRNGNDVDYVTFSSEKSDFENRYINALRNRAKTSFSSGEPLFYPGDLLWYYVATSRPHDLRLLYGDSTHGPVFARLDTGDSLNTLNLKNPLIHLLSMGQIANICGFGAVANAAAISRQATAGDLPTFVDTRKYAEDFLTQGIPNLVTEVLARSVDGYADAQDVIKAAQLLGIKDFFEIFYDVHANAGLHERIARYGTFHVACNVGGAHWALVSIVKHQDTYTMYLLNSSNAPLKNGDTVVTLIRHVDEMIQLIQRAYLCEVLQAKDIGAFNAAIAKPHVSHLLLLEELVQNYGRADNDQKDLLSEKIAACAVHASVTSSALSLDTLNFLIQQAAQKDRVWPKEFSDFVGALKTDPRLIKKDEKKKPVVSQAQSSNNTFFIGALIAGIVTCGVIMWLIKKPATQEKFNKQTASVK